MRWIQMHCLDCHKKRRVRLLELDRAKKPRCLACGGPLEADERGQERLGQAHDAQRGHKPGRRHKGCQEPAPRLIPEHEEKRCEFWEHRDLYHWCKHDAQARGRPLPDHVTPAIFYAKDGPITEAGAIIQPEVRYGSNLVGYAEQRFFLAGKPYFKVFPAIATALGDTVMRVPGAHFALPFEGMEIRLPKENNTLWPCCAAVCCRLDNSVRQDKDRDWSFVVTFFDNIPEFDRFEAGNYWVADIPIRSRELLEDSLDQTCLIHDCPNPDLVRRLVRVCVGVCFFGIDRHELILPELKRKTIDYFHGLRRQPTPHEAARALQDAKDCGLFGFKVGSEIDLPRPNLVHHEAGNGNGEHRGLTEGHLRRGHMALVAVGEGRQERRLIFRHPTIVRPDLPLRATKGYRVRKPS
jgi:hypothetical protein